MRLYIVAALCLGLVAVGGWLFFQGGQGERARQDRNTIQKREDIDDAQAACAGRGWRERLLGDCD